MRSRADSCFSRRRIGSVTGVFLLLQTPTLSLAQTPSLPTGGRVVSGQVGISAGGANTMTVTQGSSRAVVDWNSFSVGAGGTVNFVQPGASSAILNRVVGSTPSTIAGQITANGTVLLVNPNGIAITPSGTVRVGGGFVASTLDIANADFTAGRLKFSSQGTPAGVDNAGSISAAPGGFVGLIGGSVANSGTIAVPLGKVGLGAAQQVTIDPTGDGFLQVAVPSNATAANGRPLVDVAGSVKADGGRIEIRAATAEQAVRNAVNVSGVLSARSVSGHNGSIVLDGGTGGATIVSGKLLATGSKRAKGGSIVVTGKVVELRGALVDASGGTGGGTVSIGIDPAGLHPSSTTTVDGGSSIRANADEAGNGGNVKIWSDDSTSFAGHIAAHGGRNGGDGGSAEVSGKTQLTLANDYSHTALADLSAPRGHAGTLLFDPGTIDIVDQASLAGGPALNGPDIFTAQFISTQLGSSNVTIDTNNATGANGAAGDINLLSGAQIAWSTGTRLTLNAAHDINFAPTASIVGTGPSAGLTLRADSGGAGSGTVKFAGGLQVSLPLGNVDLYYNPASNRTAANGGSNPLAGAVNAASFTGTPAAENWSSFASAGTFTAWMLVNNIADLQNINNKLGANYALGANVNASAAASWNLGAGFLPLGTDSLGLVQNLGLGFAGKFDGLGHVISNLSINRTLSSNVGLFGYSSGRVANVGLVNASITGIGNVGALAGVNAGTISQSFSTGSVAGLTANVGGLVGWNKAGGSIDNTYSTASASALLGSDGGLVGSNDGSISSSYAAGAVAALLSSGGLAGSSTGSISQSYFDNQTSGQLTGVGAGSSAGATGLPTSILQNGTLPAGLNAPIWFAVPGQYPQLGWQAPPPTPPSTSTVIITATDSTGGNPVYGNSPAFGYTVTDTLGNVLCTTLCGSYFTGAPAIGSSLSSSSAAGTAATAFVAQGSLVANSGYTLRFVNETLTVAPRPLTITVGNQSKTYGASLVLDPTSFVASGLVNGDIVSGVQLASAGAGAAATVVGGPYAITASNALGSGLSNYTLGYVNGVLSVLPAQISVTALGGSSAFGSSPANPGLSAVGLQNGESVSVLTGLGNSFGITSSTGAGSYTLAVTGALSNSNYTIATTQTGTWTVTSPQQGSPTGGGSTSTPTPSSTGPSVSVPNGGGGDGALGGLSDIPVATQGPGAGGSTGQAGSGGGGKAGGKQGTAAPGSDNPAFAPPEAPAQTSAPEGLRLGE